MKVNFINSTLNFKRGIFKEAEVSTIGKEQGFYNLDGTVNTTFQPEEFMHQVFTFEAITSNGYAVLSNNDVRIQYAAIVVFQDATILKVYKVNEVGKTFENLKIKLPIGTNKIGMSVYTDAECNAQVFIPDLTE